MAKTTNNEMQLHLLQEQIIDLQHQVEESQRIISDIETKLEFLIATLTGKKEPIDTKPFDWTKLPDTIPTANLCPKCGINLSGTMSYSCPHLNCPTGLGPVYCKT